MYAQVIAEKLRKQGYDVVCVAVHPDLRGASDEELFVWAGREDRRIVTENVKDCRPILLRAEEAGHGVTAVLFTSSRTFPRSRRNPGPLIAALDWWLQDTQARQRATEDWLNPAPPRR